MTALDSWFDWQLLGSERSDELFQRLTSKTPGSLKVSVASTRIANLPFYDAHELVVFEIEDDPENAFMFGLFGPDRAELLGGESNPMHEVNELEALVLSNDQVSAYVRFFLFFLRGDEGAFALIESKEDLQLESPEGTGASGEDQADVQARLDELREQVTPLSTPEPDGQGGWALSATMVYDNSLFGVELIVAPDGTVEMADDQPIAELDGISAAGPSQLRRVGPFGLIKDGDTGPAALAQALAQKLRGAGVSDVIRRVD